MAFGEDLANDEIRIGGVILAAAIAAVGGGAIWLAVKNGKEHEEMKAQLQANRDHINALYFGEPVVPVGESRAVTAAMPAAWCGPVDQGWNEYHPSLAPSSSQAVTTVQPSLAALPPYIANQLAFEAAQEAVPASMRASGRVPSVRAATVREPTMYVMDAAPPSFRAPSVRTVSVREPTVYDLPTRASTMVLQPPSSHSAVGDYLDAMLAPSIHTASLHAPTSSRRQQQVDALLDAIQTAAYTSAPVSTLRSPTRVQASVREPTVITQRYGTYAGGTPSVFSQRAPSVVIEATPEPEEVVYEIVEPRTRTRSNRTLVLEAEPEMRTATRRTSPKSSSRRTVVLEEPVEVVTQRLGTRAPTRATTRARSSRSASSRSGRTSSRHVTG